MLNKAQIASKIASVRTRAKNLRSSIQDILINVSAHVFEHGDNSQFADLLGSTVGMDNRAIRGFIEQFGLAVVKGTGASTKVRTNKATRKTTREQFDSDSEAYLQHLIDNAPDWWDAVDAEKAAKVIDPAKSIESLATRIEKGENDTVWSVAAMRDALSDLQDALNGIESAEEMTAGFEINVQGLDVIDQAA